MPSTRPLRTRRTFRFVVVGAVGLAHIGLLLLLASTLRRPEPPVEVVREAFTVTPEAPSASSESRPARLAVPRRRKSRQAAAEEAAATPAGRPPAGTVAGSQAGSGPAGRDVADPWAVQEALRASVGCELDGLKLRPDERDRCNDHTSKWAKKGGKIGPAADDPKRAAQLAADEDYARRMHAWKSWGGSPGPANNLQDYLGPMPPKKPQP